MRDGYLSEVVAARAKWVDIPAEREPLTHAPFPVIQESLFHHDELSNADASIQPPERFGVSERGRAALIEFMESALRDSGCAIIHRSPPNEAPFRLSFVAPWGERMGVLAYAFTANTRLTKNRPEDEHRFQVKYGSKDGRLHRLWQDPFGLYTTIFLGINADQGFFVGADPVLNSPTKFFISKEFKQEHVDDILARGWHAWEREQRRVHSADPVEVLVGGRRDQFLRYVLFEREALGEDQGHRQLIAEEYADIPLRGGVLLAGGGGFGTYGKLGGRASLRPGGLRRVAEASALSTVSSSALHRLEREFDLGAADILELIAGAPRLKMAVRGWVAERHLHAALAQIDRVRNVRAIEQDGQPDFEIEVRGARRPIRVECKNVLRATDRSGRPRLDFMRTRASPTDPCSRYYSATDFDVVAACLHASTERWEFAARETASMLPHPSCGGKLSHRVVIDDQWTRDLGGLLAAAAS